MECLLELFGPDMEASYRPNRSLQIFAYHLLGKEHEVLRM